MKLKKKRDYLSPFIFSFSCILLLLSYFHKINSYALAKANEESYKSQLRLASQKRINHVSDDTSGFTVGKSLEQKVNLMSAAQNNIGSAKDMLSTAESQLINIKDLVTAIKAKITDSTNAAADKSRIKDDIVALGNEISNIFKNTKYNNTSLLVSSATGNTGTFTFQTGAESSDTLGVDFASGLVGSSTGNSVGGLSSTVATGLASLAATTSTTISGLTSSLNSFETTIDDSLAKVGNAGQRLDVKESFLTSAITNSKASISRLFDADMALEQLNSTKGQMAAQVATSMFSQLNMAPQNVLQLFK